MARPPFVMVTGGMITEAEVELLVSQIVMRIWEEGNAKITIEEVPGPEPARHP